MAGTCWNCRAEFGKGAESEPDGEFTCPACGKLQPIGRDSDYFALMGADRHLRLDAQELERSFHALSRRFHPDRHRQGLPRERMIALENVSRLNEAYRTLRDPFTRAAYLAKLELGEASGPAPGAPQQLFEEILELQEQLGDFRMAEPDEQAELRPSLQAKQAELQAETERQAGRLTGELAQRWDAVDSEERADLLREVRTILDERGYLNRLLDSLGQALSQAPTPALSQDAK